MSLTVLLKQLCLIEGTAALHYCFLSSSILSIEFSKQTLHNSCFTGQIFIWPLRFFLFQSTFVAIFERQFQISCNIGYLTILDYFFAFLIGWWIPHEVSISIPTFFLFPLTFTWLARQSQLTFLFFLSIFEWKMQNNSFNYSNLFLSGYFSFCFE